MDKQVDEITRAVMRLYDDVTHTDARGQIDLDRVREHFAELHDALYARQDPPALSAELIHSPKTFRVMENVGKAKYVVNFHDGVKTHPDGSAFFDIETFKNKKNFRLFVQGLVLEGYREI